MKSKISKKGMSGMSVFLVVAVLAVISLLGFSVFGPSTVQQTALQVPAEERSLAVNTGQIASVKMKAVDKESSTLAQVSVPAYVWNSKDPSHLLNDATVLSASTTTAVNSVSIGDNICYTAFNASFYGDVACKTISAQSDLLEIPVHAVATSALIETYYKASIGDVNDELNISLGANQADSFTKLRIQNNNSNEMLNLKALVVDTVVRSNISDATVLGMEENSALPARLIATDQANYRFDLPNALALREFEDFITGTFTLKADGDGCNGVNTENVVLRWLDESRFKSVKGADAGSIALGVEDNANSPADVGRADLTLQFVCNAA